MANHIKFFRFSMPLLACAIFYPTAASASVATGTLPVSITIEAACSVESTTGVAFGTAGILTANTDASGSLTVQCTNATPYTIALDAGGGTGATTSSRKMTFSSSTVQYNLYRDVSRTQTWGNTQGTDTVAGTGSGSNQTITVYGRVPTQTSPTAGTYTDTVNVTVTY